MRPGSPKNTTLVLHQTNLFAIGAANLVSGITGGYPVSGGLARSTVSLEAGAATPLSAALTATCVLLIVVVTPNLLASIPNAVLAATIFAAGLSQLGFSDFRKAWAWNRAEGVGYLAALGGVLWLGLAWGLLIGFGASIALIIVRSICPTIKPAFIEPADNSDLPDLRLQVTVYGDINFLSAPRIADEIVRAVHTVSRPHHIQLLSADGRAMDFTANERLKTLAAQLHKHGVQLAYPTKRDRSQQNAIHNWRFR